MPRSPTRALVRLAATLAACALALDACSSLRAGFVKHASSALPPAKDTPSARYIAAELDAHADQSGFRLLSLSSNALLSRVALADHAEHSIDLQYYIFRNDATGRLLAQHLLTAADRGVRVRILLDDADLAAPDRILDALDAHENVEIRLFNPFRARNPSLLSKAAQFLLEGRRLNRRMHNKSFISDSRVAIIGGRNIGNDYFDASTETNFRDLDLVAIGPVVREASRVFDAYWNSDAAIPVTAYDTAGDTHVDLGLLRTALAKDARSFAESDYAQAALEELPNGPSGDRRGEWFWGPAELVADQPADALGGARAPALRIGPKLWNLLETADADVFLISPYFVPGESGARSLIEVAARGVTIQVLTNSLAATDAPAAHSGYARYRRRLLAGGVELFELRPAPGAEPRTTARGASSGVSLHAKALVVDRRYVFIGSPNMDQRSKLINTEMGLIVDSAPLALAVRKFFDDAIQPANSFRVALDGHATTWSWREGETQMHARSDPGATAQRRMLVLVSSLLPIEGLL